MPRQSLQLFAFALLAGACATQPAAPSESSLLIGGGDCPFPYEVDGAPPIETNKWNTFNLGRTIPVKIRVSLCPGSSGDVNSLAPQFALELLDPVNAPVTVIVSSAEVDEGTTLRSAGEGQYLFNLSTKLSQLDGSIELPPGEYRLIVSSPGDFPDVVYQFWLQ
jgi:hypothetical protein